VSGRFTSGQFTSWGGLAARASHALAPDAWRGSDPVLPYGNGRSYGDSCLLDRGGLIDMRGRRRIESFDAATGLLVAESGLLIADLLEAIIPAGWFVPVTPGTRYVTLGGALANDVHGKNHHARGTFGCHVAWFDLERSDGRTLRCSGLENRDLFAATIGGMGLTGLITRLALQLIPVRGPMMRQDVIPFGSLADFFALAAASDSSHQYTVAWIDQLATGAALGKGVFFRANHDEAADSAAAFRLRKPLPLLPATPPIPLINRATLAGFNALYAFAHRRPASDVSVRLEPFFYPLDRVGGWSRAYGPRGLRQHQSVVPADVAPDAVRELLLAAQAAGEASFLTVLKLFGDRPSPGLMSFPMPGATLTLDFPYRGPRTDKVLDELDRIVIAAGGRVNPYKDARMSPAVFEASFPHWRDFAHHIDPAFASNFWRRVTG
jgi:FAD/FMN-containing dehydrogenase